MTSPTLWSNGDRQSLLASRDPSTGELMFPTFVEGSPLAETHEAAQLPPDGVVYSYTVIHPNPKSGELPYALGYVDMDGPVRLFGRLRGKDRPQIGDRYRAVADDAFGYAFEYVVQDANKGGAQ